MEIKFLSSLSQGEKKYLRKQFIRLMEISFYTIYFTKSASSIASQKRMF